MTGEKKTDAELVIEAVQRGETIRLFGNYQAASNSFINTPRYKDKLDFMNNAALGICGEGGEYADIIKKVIYHGIPLTEELRLKLKKELGDILWYVSEGALALDTTLDEIATLNIAKLADRHQGAKFNEQAAMKKDESTEGVRHSSLGALSQIESEKSTWLCGKCEQLKKGLPEAMILEKHSRRCPIRESEDNGVLFCCGGDLEKNVHTAECKGEVGYHRQAAMKELGVPQEPKGVDWSEVDSGQDCPHTGPRHYDINKNEICNYCDTVLLPKALSLIPEGFAIVPKESHANELFIGNEQIWYEVSEKYAETPKSLIGRERLGAFEYVIRPIDEVD